MKRLFLILTLMMGLVSCGGGGGGKGGGGTTTDTVQNHLPSSLGDVSGVFVDAGVQGLSYSSTSHSGTTGANGSYTCKAGEVVTFSLGNFELGQSPCRHVITPVEVVTMGSVLFNDSSLDAEDLEAAVTSGKLTRAQVNKMLKMASILQTLDSDGNLSNGITIQSSDVDELNTLWSNEGLTNLVSDTDFDSNWVTLVTTLASNAGTTARTNTTSLMTHFASSVTTTDSSLCKTSNVANSSSVTGFASSCVVLSCNSGYFVENNACVENTVNNGGGGGATFNNRVCLYGATKMQGTQPTQALGDGSNHAFTLIVLDTDTNAARVYRTAVSLSDESSLGWSVGPALPPQVYTGTHYNYMRTNKTFRMFTGQYNRADLISSGNSTEMIISQVSFSDLPNTFYEFDARSMPNTTGQTLWKLQGAFGDVGTTTDFRVETQCTLPSSVTQ